VNTTFTEVVIERCIDIAIGIPVAAAREFQKKREDKEEKAGKLLEL
jgi:hypothetical protein